MNPNIIILGECWLRDSSGIEETNAIKEYTAFYTRRNKNKSDGVAVFLKEDTNKYNVTELNSETMTGFMVELEKENITIYTIYRPPNLNVKNFITDLKEIITRNKNSKDNRIMIVGDINLDIRTQNDLSNQYLTTMAELGLIPCINEFTRVTNKSNTCLDHIFYSMKNKKEINNTIILQSQITDHYPTVIEIKQNYRCEERDEKTKLVKKRLNIMKA